MKTLKKSTKAGKLPDLSNRARAMMTRKNALERQSLKKKLDRRCKFSETEDGSHTYQGLVFDTDVDLNRGSSENWVRLLDEGVVIDGSMEPFAIIRKGAIKDWYDNLSENFVGNIDKDHNRSIDLGTFTKKDLKLVELGDGRYGVDVNVRLDDELYATRDLKRMNNRKAISSEFYSTNDEAVKASAIDGKEREWDYYIPIFDQVQITGYGIVDSPMNANSYDDELLVNASTTLAEFSTEEGQAMTEEELKAKAAAEAAEAQENAEEAKAEEATEAPEATEATDASTEVEAEGAEEATETEPEATETEETDASEEEEFSAQLAKFEETIKNFKAEIAEKDAKIAEYKAKLEAKEAAKNAFEAKLAEMLDFATVSDITAPEGGATTTTPTNTGDEVLNAYASAFADLSK